MGTVNDPVEAVMQRMLAAAAKGIRGPVCGWCQEPLLDEENCHNCGPIEWPWPKRPKAKRNAR